MKIKNNYRLIKLASKMHRRLEDLAEVTVAASSIVGAPTLRNYFGLGTLALSKVAKHVSYNPDERMDLAEVVSIAWGMRPFLKKIAANYPTEVFDGDHGSTVQVSDIHGDVLTFRGSGWNVDMWIQRKGEAEGEAESSARASTAFGRAIWEFLGPQVEVVAGAEKNMPALQRLEPSTLLASAQGEGLVVRTKKFLATGRRRAILLHGPPGTGKTCMSYYIASKVAGTCLSVSASSLVHMPEESLYFMLSVLHPDILLVDDLDRISDVSTVLPAIDRARKTTKLMIITVNHLKKMDAAVKRAKRFDDVVEVLRIRQPEDIVPEFRERLGGEAMKKMDTWPIAFVEELADRVAVLDEEVWDAEFADLEARVADNSEGGGK